MDAKILEGVLAVTTKWSREEDEVADIKILDVLRGPRPTIAKQVSSLRPLSDADRAIGVCFRSQIIKIL